MVFIIKKIPANRTPKNISAYPPKASKELGFFSLLQPRKI